MEVSLMSEKVAMQDVNNLNYQLFVQFRDLYRESQAEAMIRYKFNPDEAKLICSASHIKLRELSETGVLNFKLNITNKLHSV